MIRKHLYLEGAEVEADGLGAALLVAGAHRGELGVVGLAGLVKVVHRLPRQRVLQAALEVEAAVLHKSWINYWKI